MKKYLSLLLPARRSFTIGGFLVLLYACNSGTAVQNKNEDSTHINGAQKMDSAHNILVFGNSLTAGYGLDDPSEAFPSLIQKRIDSAGLVYRVINAGVSGETTAGGNSRIDWILRQPLDIFILELGANDGLRGIPLSETRKNLQSIVDKVKKKYPSAKLLLAGMQVPPNMGQDYTSEFRSIYPDLAQKNNMQLIPFLLEGVGGNTHLNQKDGIHPTAEGHRILADNVWRELMKVL